MPDYISRDAALIVLDWDCASQDALDGIKAIPAADVVEVVRCRECKHHDGIRCFCWNSVIVTRFDDYCSNGERKDGGQDEAPASPYDLLYEEGGYNSNGV